MSVFYLFIAFPIIFITVLSFIFSSGLTDVAIQNVKINCPYTINSAIANNTNVNPSGTIITYDVYHDSDTDDYHVTKFLCEDVGGLPAVSTIVYTADTTNNWFDITSRASGYMFYISSIVSAFAEKVVAYVTIGYLFINAPAEVSGLDFFSYINGILFLFIGLGTFMIIRGTGS